MSLGAFLDVGLKNITNTGRMEPPSCSDGMCFGCEQGIKRVQDSDIQKRSGVLNPVFFTVMGFSATCY